MSKIVEIQVRFHLKECLPPDIKQCQLPGILSISRFFPILLLVILLGREQMTHKLKLKKAVCKDFLTPDLLKVNFK